MSVGMIARAETRQHNNWQAKRTQSREEDSAEKERRQRLIEQAHGVNLVQLVGHYTQLRRKSGGEYAGPCPKCGGEDRFTVDAKGWFCRVCKPYDDAHGWYGPIDFVMWQQGLRFMEAVAFLTGANMSEAIRTQPRQPEAPQRTEQTDEWRAEAEAVVKAAQYTLFNAALCGGEYLQRRGLVPETWQAFGWGLTTYKERWAIVMPWYRAGKLNAIRYRYLEPTPDGQRLIAHPGSKFSGALYGGQALEPGAEGLRTLVLCEGEINAASIWQAAHDSRVDVLSLGSESARLTDAMTAHAEKYKHVIVWMDKREVALKLRDQLPERTVAVSSPVRPGPDGAERKWDANDMLRTGKLGAFLTAVRLRCCGDDAKAREGLLWDIWDMARLPLGIDPGTGAAAWKLAGELGKDVKLYQCPDGAWRGM